MLGYGQRDAGHRPFFYRAENTSYTGLLVSVSGSLDRYCSGLRLNHVSNAIMVVARSAAYGLQGQYQGPSVKSRGTCL